MARNTLPPRRRILPIERVAGIITQFERTDGGYLYRQDGWGPAIMVTPAERDSFVRDGHRALILHVLALVLCGAAAWLFVVRAGLVGLAFSTTVASIISIAAMLLLVSYDGAKRAPARALQGRPIARPPRDPDYVKRYSYGTIVALIVIALLWLLTGSGEMADRAWLVVPALLIGGFLLMRRRSAYRDLSPDQRERAAAAHAREATYERERLARAKPVNGCALLLFFLVEVAVGLAALFGTIVVVLRIAGQPAEQPNGWIFAGAFVLGIILSCLFVSQLDRLGKRWTGASAIEQFNWLPDHW